MKDQDSFQMVEFPASTDGVYPRGDGMYPRGGYQMGRPALVRKGGQYRIAYKGMGQRGKRFLLDLYQTLIDLKWRYVMLIVCVMFMLAYLVFAILWYLMALSHNDLAHVGDPNWKPCIVNMRNFADAMLFSIETQTTIGFGTLYPDTDCWGTIPLVYLQVTIGFLLETLLLGFVLVKISRPKNRRKTLVYSNVATVVKEDGELVLQVRLGDLRQSHLVDTRVYGIYIQDKVSDEGVHYPLYQHYMAFQAHGMNDRVFLIWPMVLTHKIDQSSPLYGKTPEEILHANTFEIVVILEGTIESTGEICQARTSYTSKDLLWGYRFDNIVEFDHEHGKWRANFKLFDDVVASPTPKCSAKYFFSKYNPKERASDTESGKADDTVLNVRDEATSNERQKKRPTTLIKKLKDSLTVNRF